MIPMKIKGTPAEAAGLRGARWTSNRNLILGDVIQKIDGQTIRDADDLFSALERHKTGDTVDVTYLREGETKSVKIQLQTPST